MKNINVYDIWVWERVFENLPNAYKRWFKIEAIYLKKNITKNAEVLEVGCGDGRTLNDVINITKNLVGIDHDPNAVFKTKRNLKKYKTIKILRAEATKLPFKEKTFDFVLCMTTFANFGNKKYKVLKEMKRVLKDNGQIIISVFSENAFNERIKIYKKIKFPIKRIVGTSVMFDDKYGEGISEQFSKEELRKIFTKTKLKIVEIKKLNIAYICKLKK